MSKIVALVTIHADQVAGGAPIFIAKETEEQQLVANALEKILDATAHDLKNGTLILVAHTSIT